MAKTEIYSTLEEAKKIYPEIPIGRCIDIRGQKFNKLLVVYRTNNKGKQPAYVCKCDCGNYTVQPAGALKTLTIKSCGCWRKERLSLSENKYIQQAAGQKRGEQLFIDYSNKTVGKITFLKPIEKNQRGYKWQGRCECGNTTFVQGADITRAIKKNTMLSCGCYQWNELDLTGQKYGKLTPIKKSGKDKYNHYLWYCKCDCGNFVEVIASHLINGNTQSCGCLNSKNESIISQLLKELNLKYLRQYSFKGCLGRFDFFINNFYVIEFDGIQHFKYKSVGWNNKENFEKTRVHDLIKNKYCFDHNIPLIRIPYDADYTIDDLKLETTRFLLTPENEKEYYERRK